MHRECSRTNHLSLMHASGMEQNQSFKHRISGMAQSQSFQYGNNAQLQNDWLLQIPMSKVVLLSDKPNCAKGKLSKIF